ncbi:MAG: FAD binding domain-containing protein [Polyangiaceae bacterium]
MLPLPRFGLAEPRTVAEATRILSELGDGAVLMAGGTDLLPNMKHGLVEPRTVVSLQRVEGLRDVRYEPGADGGRLHLGAMATLDAVASNELVCRLAPALAQAAQAVAGPHHRRMGTLGGNLCLDTRCRYFNQTHFWRSALGFCLKKDGSVCHVVAGGQRCVAAASNDTAPAVIALEGSLVLESARGRRTLDVSSFYTADGVYNTTRERDEILVEVVLPVRPGRKSGFEKLRRRAAIDFPLLSIAARVDDDATDLRNVAAIDIVVSALAARPRRLGAAQKVAAGVPRSPALVETLANASHRECHPLENIEGDAEWRREMVPVLVRRLLHRLFELPG